MSLFEQMKTIKSKVKYLLQKHPHLRDNDYKLIATFYRFEIGDTQLKTLSGYDVLKMIADGKLSHSESIRRDRAQLQKDVKELRGDKYNTRIAEGVHVSKSIHEL